MFKFKRQISIHQNTEISVLKCHYLVFSYWESLVYHSVEIPLLLQFWYICQGLVLDSVCYHWLREGAFLRSAGVLCISFGFHIFQSPFVFPSLSLFSVCGKSLNLSLVKSLFVHVCVHMFVLLLPPPTPSCLHVMELNTFNFTFAFSLASLSFFQSLFKCITFFYFRLYFLFNFSYSGRLFMWQLKSSYLTVY